MKPFFPDVAVRFEGPQSDNHLAYRWYDPDRLVLGKRMEDHLRFAVCYWHTFTWQGNDPFGGPTLLRPWMKGADPMAKAEAKLGAAFEMFAKLGIRFFTFHDRDVAPEGDTLGQSNANLDRIADKLEAKMARTGVHLLWGTANLFSHRRYMSGAATNPDPEVFAYAAAQVRHVMGVTNRLAGRNYVLWGGREGYETLLNTDLARESDQIGRFVSMVVEHKHKIGFKGTILVEPKPHEPTKHQYDYDASAIHAFLLKYGLEKEIKLNIEVNHATLAGHSFEHEIAYAAANGLFGSIDINRGDPLLGWDTDQFPNSVPDVALAMFAILRAGGLTTGGLNFDAKLRRQSIEPDDVLLAHIGGIDVCARALLVAARMIEDGALQERLDERYAGWQAPLGKDIVGGGASLDSLSQYVLDRDLEPEPRSGRQELLENIVNSYL